MEPTWPLRLFSKSVLKQTKFKRIVEQLGATAGLRCLDIGSDNGVLSYLLRQRGGDWKSADLDERSVSAIRELVQTEVYQLGEASLPFQDDEFDVVVVIDFLEHIADDAGFMREVGRVLKPGGTLIINAPQIQQGWLVKFRGWLGLTEEEHGHVRPGYTQASIRDLLGADFQLQHFHTYTKSFAKFADTLMVYTLSRLKRGRPEPRSGRGILVTGSDLTRYQRLFTVYSLIYPCVWLFSQLDRLLPATAGYMLIVKARSNKQPGDTLCLQKNHSASWSQAAPVLPARI